jgi:hypothetical protein
MPRHKSEPADLESSLLLTFRVIGVITLEMADDRLMGIHELL